MLKGTFKIIVIFWVFTLLGAGCKSLKELTFRRDIRKEIENSPVFSSQFTGLCLFDPETSQYLSQYNDGLYFTPASNIKVLTALACLETFTDSIPSFAYRDTGDTLVIKPLADPSFLHKNFPRQRAFDFLRSNRYVAVDFPDHYLPKFGPGWAWEDYQYQFQPQRSWFPIYGNVVRIYKEDSLYVKPEFFWHYTNVNLGKKSGDGIYRDRKYNLFNVWVESEASTFEREIPFDYSKELLLTLLRDTLGVPVWRAPENEWYTDTLYNQSTVGVLGAMLPPSDNFLAEQLLIQAALQNGYTDTDSFRASLLNKWSDFNPLPIYWYDGSGLSRYNLITPRSMVAILHQIYLTSGWEKIKAIFPAGGVSGTIKNWYSAPQPYLFAKTGTLRNNHCLSGYLITRSGKKLIFSFMNNHYTTSTEAVKMEMEKLLVKIRDAY